MKNYNPKFIKDFIEQNKEKIEAVDCGMSEDWCCTAATVYADGKYLHNLSGDSLTLVGIAGSCWATPVMEVTYKDGETETKDCYIDDGTTTKEESAKRKVEFEAATSMFRKF